MRLVIILGVVLAFLLPLSGCGGGGGSELPSPYAGSWAGTMGVTDGSGGTGGAEPSSVNVVVDSRGRFTGAWEDSTASGSLSGSVGRDGQMSLSATQPGDPPLSLRAAGNTTLAQGGSWQGSLAITEGQVGSGVVFELVRQ